MKVSAHPLALLSLISSPFFLVACTDGEVSSSVSRAFRQLVLDDHPSSSVNQGVLSADLEDSSEPQTPLDLHHNRRKLQEFSEICNTTYVALWKDEDLRNAYQYYSYNKEQTQAALTSDGSNVCSTNAVGDVITCDFDEPITGETELRNACTAAGGRVLAYSMDVKCSISDGGAFLTAILDEPASVDCIPSVADGFDSTCVAEFAAIVNAITDANAELGEAILNSDGTFSTVNCESTPGGDANIMIEEDNSNGGSSSSSNVVQDENVADDGGEGVQSSTNTQQSGSGGSGSGGSSSSNAASMTQATTHCWLITILMMGAFLFSLAHE